MKLIGLAQDRDKWRALVNVVTNLWMQSSGLSIDLVADDGVCECPESGVAVAVGRGQFGNPGKLAMAHQTAF
jgi:hypothetical protein